MDEKDKVRDIHNHFETGSNCQVFNGTIHNAIFAMPGAQVTQMAAKAEEQTKSESEMMDADLLEKAVKAVKKYIWGNAAYAVLFCVCRDEYGWQDNVSLFERQLILMDISIPSGTLNAAISRNPYMRQPVSKWKALGVMERVMVLVDNFRECIAQLTAKA